MEKKKKVVVFCEPPLSLLSGTSVTAHNYRSQQFVDFLCHHGIPTIAVVINRNSGFRLLENRPSELLEYWEVDDRKIGWRTKARRRLAKENLCAAIGLMLNGAMMAHSLVKRLPLWVDFYGDPLIEKIGQDTHYSNQYGTLAMRWHLRRVLAYADRFSVCSEAQKSLLVGAFLYLGRLDFGNLMLPVVNTFYYLGGAGSPDKRVNNRNKRMRTRPVTILYNGSVNSWTDVSFLSEVLDEVLTQRPNVRFVQFGKNIVNTEHMLNFQRFAAKKEIKGRVQFLGEVPEGIAQEIYDNSHICISADVDTLETRFGWRTRYIRAMKEGLVIASTLGNDLAAMLADEGVGLFSPIGDRNAFVKNLLTLIDNQSLRRRLSDKGVHYVAAKSLDNSQFKNLVLWLEKPEKLRLATNELTTARNVVTYLRWSVAGRLSR